MIKAWSYSRKQVYDTCPFLAKCKFIDKLDEPKAPAMARGIAIHKEAEDYLLKRVRALPKSLKKLDKEFRLLRQHNPFVEEQLAFDEDWNPVDWFHKRTWLRVKQDACEEVDYGKFRTIDVKTGNPRGEYEEQLELYGLSVFLTFEDVEEVKTQMWFVDTGEIITGPTVTAKDVPKLQKKFKQATKRMLNDTRFDPTPSYKCKWCHFRKSNGGPCKHG